MRRSSYQQIIEWNARRGEQHRPGMELVREIDALSAEVDAIAEIAPLHLQFVPIRLVTILEVFLREVIAGLVDGDQVPFEQVEKLVKGAKIDLAFAAHLDRRELTIGDFVAHSVSLNGLDGIMSIMNTLVDGFAGRLKTAHPRWSEEVASWPLAPTIPDYDAAMAALARLFEVRHVLTHELPSENAFDPKELPSFIKAAQSFIAATDWTTVEVLSGSVPKTQMGMNMLADEALRDKEDELASVLKEVEALTGIEGRALREMQSAWADFADRHAALVASQVEGGSMHSLVWASEKVVLTRDRITQLKDLVGGWIN